jgi:hypothetical protein
VGDAKAVASHRTPKMIVLNVCAAKADQTVCGAEGKLRVRIGHVD